MAKWFFVVETSCNDASREAEFNEWYNKIHLPDVLETPGFVRATRFENTEPAAGKAKFLALYEIETDDINKTMQASRDNLAKKRAAGRISDLLTVTSRAIYQQTASQTRR